MSERLVWSVTGGGSDQANSQQLMYISIFSKGFAGLDLVPSLVPITVATLEQHGTQIWTYKKTGSQRTKMKKKCFLSKAW